jgi:hypothetical protein
MVEVGDLAEGEDVELDMIETLLKISIMATQNLIFSNGSKKMSRRLLSNRRKKSIVAQPN